MQKAVPKNGMLNRMARPINVPPNHHHDSLNRPANIAMMKISQIKMFELRILAIPPVMLLRICDSGSSLLLLFSHSPQCLHFRAIALI